MRLEVCYSYYSIHLSIHKFDTSLLDTFDTKLAYALRNLDDGEQSTSESSSSSRQVPDSQASTKAAWKNLLKMPEPSIRPSKSSTTSAGKKVQQRRRLGVSAVFCLHGPLEIDFIQKAELGPHANEEQMPSWLGKHYCNSSSTSRFRSCHG